MAEERHCLKALDLITELEGSPDAVADLMKSLPRSSLRGMEAGHQTARVLFPWMNGAGVQAMGVAEKFSAGQPTDELCIKIYVEKKLPRDKIDEPIPDKLDLPGLPTIATDVEAIGKIELHSNTNRLRPAVPGFSIGRAVEAKEAGTFGMVVRKKGTTRPFYLLSNSHAIAASGFGSKGDVIIQPGAADGGTADNDRIGTLEEWVPFKFTETGYPNLVDAAIARLDEGVASAAISDIGIPTGVSTELTRGMEVQKVGRTTTYSVARVKDVNLRVPSTYPQADGKLGRVGLADQVLASFYTSGGDSGSAVLNMKNEVVGLHEAGSAVIGVFCKIANIMDALGVEVVTTANFDPAG